MMKFKLPYLLIGFGFTVCALKETFSDTVDEEQSNKEHI